MVSPTHAPSLSTGIMLDTLAGSNISLGAQLVTALPQQPEEGVPELDETQRQEDEVGWFGNAPGAAQIEVASRKSLA